MTPDDSEQPNQPPKASNEDDWGDDWGDATSQEDAADTRLANPTEEAPEEVQAIRRPAGQLKLREISAGKPERIKPEPSAFDNASQLDPQLVPAGRQSIEDKEWSSPGTFNLKWVLPVAFVVIAVIVGCLVLMQQKMASQPTKSTDKSKSPFDAQVEAELKELHDRKDEACKLYADFASAQVVEEILPMVRNAAEMRELIRQTGHQRMVEKNWRPGIGVKWTQEMLRGNRKPYACLSGELPDFNNFRAYFVLEGGYLLIDWKATTAYSTASFQELINGKGDGREVRGYMKPASLPTAVWPEDQYQCYQLESPDRRDIIWCYVKRGSEVARQLGAFFQKGEIIEQSASALPMTVKLARGPADGLPNQWLIEGVHHRDWIEIQ